MKATLQREQRPATPQERNDETFISPVVNIYETKEGYLLEAEMPGVNKGGLEVTLEGNEITITGRRQAETLVGQPLLRESVAVDFRRVFEVDPAIDTSRISARMEQGVLQLTLPKSAQVKPRRISVD
jgi:HSP20 family protein